MFRPLGRGSIEADAARLRALLATVGGVPADHGTLSGLADDDHAQYVHISAARTITAKHSFSPGAADAPFALGANAQGQTVTGFKADQLNKIVTAGDGLSGGGALTASISLAVDSTVVRTTRTITAGNGLAGGGSLAADRTISLGTPTTLTATSPNAVTAGSHTHAIDSTLARSAITISAGNGLAGGGSLAANRTISMGTPSTLSVSSTNAATAGSHTHAIDASSTPGAASSLLRTDTNGSIALSGKIGLGVVATYKLDVRDTATPQFRVGRSATQYFKVSVDSFGNSYLEATGGAVIIDSSAESFEVRADVTSLQSIDGVEMTGGLHLGGVGTPTAGQIHFNHDVHALRRNGTHIEWNNGTAGVPNWVQLD